MLTPYYQEFANRCRSEHRDNTVICTRFSNTLAEIGYSLRVYHENGTETGTFRPFQGPNIPFRPVYTDPAAVAATPASGPMVCIRSWMRRARRRMVSCPTCCPNIRAIRYAAALGFPPDAIVVGNSHNTRITRMLPVRKLSAMLSPYSTVSRHSRNDAGTIDVPST